MTVKQQLALKQQACHCLLLVTKHKLNVISVLTLRGAVKLVDST